MEIIITVFALIGLFIKSTLIVAGSIMTGILFTELIEIARTKFFKQDVKKTT